MPRLTAVIEAKGWDWEVRGQELLIDMPAERSADLDRAAGEAGLALRMLTPQRGTLETVYLDMTGASDDELAERRSAQREQGPS